MSAKAKWDDLADKARFEALLMFEDETTVTLDLYRMGESANGAPVGTLVLALDYPSSERGEFKLGA